MKAATHPNEKLAQFAWTGFILMFFMIQAVIWTIAITVTARDSSHAVVSGYDELALKWDEVKQLQQDSAKLGWECEISVAENGDVIGNRTLTFQLNDRQGKPIEAAQIDLTAFHRAHASKKRPLTVVAAGGGTYTATLLVNKSGKWQFSGQATCMGDQFLIEQTINIDKTTGR